MGEDRNLLTYEELLNALGDTDGEKHVLLGNGFNQALRVDTSYKAIYKMLKSTSDNYKILEPFLNEHYDFENLLYQLKKSLNKDARYTKSQLLPKEIEERLKKDFARAIYSIIHRNYDSRAIRDNSIYEFFRHFTSFFTLNFDPLLYRLLMHLKRNEPRLFRGRNEPDDYFRKPNALSVFFANPNRPGTIKLYYPHGAFHIYKKDDLHIKLATNNDSWFHDLLEDSLEKSNYNFVFVSTGDSQGKVNIIKRDEYLTQCFDKLAELKGTLAILGCSFSDTDEHIFNQIQRSEVSTIYIGVSRKKDVERKEIQAAARKFFDKDHLIFFDYGNITFACS